MANETILIVDADQKSQKVLEVSFKKAGHRVVISESVADAHEQIRLLQPSLIIADTSLPDGDGLEFCADLKFDPATKAIPLIFLTEDRSLSDKMRALELGADDYLTKPIYIKEVITKADLLIQRRAKELLTESDVEEFKGDLSDITMIDLLQTIEEERRSGSIRIQRGSRQGALFFRNGQVLDAVCGKLQGADAVYRMMIWSEGQFVISYHDNSRRIDYIEKSADEILFEGIRRIEVINELSQRLPESNRIFEADYQRLPALLRTVPPEVERVVRLFDGYRPFRDVVEDSPVDDITTLQIFDKLLSEDVLIDITPADGGPRTPPPKTLDEWLSGGEPDTSETSSVSTDNTDRIAKPAVGHFADTTLGDEIDTAELNRSPASDTDPGSPRESVDPSDGGGHWKFHWGGSGHSEVSDVEDDDFHEPLFPPEQSQEPAPSLWDEDSFDDETPQNASAPQTYDDDLQLTREVPIDEAAALAAMSADPEAQISESLRELEEQERIRREEEARHLAQQLQRATDLSLPTTDDDLSDSRQQSPGPEEQPREFRRQRSNTPISSPALAMASVFEDDDDDDDDDIGADENALTQDQVSEPRPSPSHSEESVQTEPASHSRTERPTSRIGVPQEIKDAALQRRQEQSDPDPLTDDDSSAEAVPTSAEAPETQEIEAASLFPEFDPNYVERTDQFPPPQLQRKLPLTVERNSEEQTVIFAEFDLRKRTATRQQLSDTAAGLPAEEDPTPVPLSEQSKPTGELIADGPNRVDTLDPIEPSARELIQAAGETDDHRSGDDHASADASPDTESAQATSDSESASDSQEDHSDDETSDSAEEAEEDSSPEAIDSTAEDEDSDQNSTKDPSSESSVATVQKAKPKDEPKDEPKDDEQPESRKAAALASTSEEPSASPETELPGFDDDFEADLGLGSNGWQKWAIFAAIAALIAIILAFLTITGGPEEADVEPPPIATAEAPVEAEPEPELAVVDEPLQEAAPEDQGLDSQQARMRAEFEGASVEFAARDITQVLGEARAAEQAALLAEQEAAAPAEEPAPAPAPATPSPQAVAERSLNEDIQRLRSMIDRDQIDQALTLARDLTARAPNNRQIAFLHGQAALYDNKNTEAIEHLRRARRLGLNTGDLYLELATAYQVTGQRDQARQAYESFLQVQPTGRSADEVRTILESQF